MKKNSQHHLSNIFQIILKYLNNDTQGIYSATASFYVMMSAIPLVMLLLSMLHIFFPLSQDQLIEIIQTSLPTFFQSYVQRIITELYTQSTVSLMSVTAIAALWAASKSSFALSKGLMRIYDTEPKDKGFLYTIRLRIVSLFDTIVFLIILIMCLSFFIFDNWIETLLISISPEKLQFLPRFLHVSRFASVLVITIGFSLIYRLFSKSRMWFYRHIPGALFAALGWIIFSYLFSIYINNFSKVSITYGALAILVIFMLWLNICMIIFLFGAQVNQFLFENDIRLFKKSSED